MPLLRSIICWSLGILQLIIVFPFAFVIWILTLPFDKHRLIIHRIINFQSILLVNLLPLCKVSIKNNPNINTKGPYVIISNHQSILDILAINKLHYRLKWVSKYENLKVPILGWYLRMANYICINRKDPECKTFLMNKGGSFLKQGISIMIFPEGTRAISGNILPFKQGAFKLAIDNNVPIVPLIIKGTDNILPKHGLMLREGKHVKVKVLNPIMPDNYKEHSLEDIASACRELMIAELYKL